MKLVLNILSIGHSERGGGLQTVFRISNNINNPKIKIIKAFCSDELSTADINLKRVRDYKNPIKRIFSYFFIPNNYIGISNYLKNNKVDIIHIHGNIDISVLLAVKKYKNDTKIVFTSHGYGLVCPTYSCYSYKQESICTECVSFGNEIRVIKNKCDKRGYLFSALRYIDFIIKKKLTNNYSLYDSIVTPSTYLQQLLLNSKHNFKNVNVVSNPIEVNYFPVSSNSKNDIITFVGRFSKEKNVSHLIDAFSQLLKEQNFKNLKLNILGDGPEKGNYIKKIKEYGIEENVYISENLLSQKDLKKYLIESKALVLPTVSPETFGLVIFEGIRYGLIPICLKIGAQEENISKLKFGLLYENNEVDGLKNAIKEVLTNYKMLSKEISNVNLNIDQNFSVDEYHRKISSLYNVIMQDLNSELK
jgi:glycosyltransferase involved in cell wall biosynthesis